MHQFDSFDHLRLLAQERERHLENVGRIRVAEARAEVARQQQRVDDAWRELVRALDDVDVARRALVAIDHR